MSGETARALEVWFAGAARDLPWRRGRNGYTALVAEAMLQQTQASRVVDRYEAFLELFPDVVALAEADEQSVLAAWQGLGYYRRARHLHAAARMVVTEHAGAVPDSVETLRRLPGVGRYTAGAVASMVYGKVEPIVDGNVQRVLTRLDGDDAAPGEPETIARTWRRAAELVEAAADPGAFNEAMMELGATVCTPKSPRCGDCPLAARCVARRKGRQDEIPPPKRPAARRQVHHHAVIVRRGTKILLEQRDHAGLWARMWQTPTIEAERPMSPREIERRLVVTVTDLQRMTTFEHNTTHRRIRFHVLTARSRARRGVWRHPDETTDLPMSNAQRKVLAEAIV